MKLMIRMSLALALVAAAACSEPTAPATPVIPLPDLEPRQADISIPVP